MMDVKSMGIISMHDGEDTPKVLGHASISKWAVGARTSGGHHSWGEYLTKGGDM